MQKSKLRENLETRAYSSSLTERQYNLSIGLTLTYGVIVSAVLAYTMKERFLGANPWLFCLLYLVLGFTGQCIAISSSNAFLSFFAYNLVVVPTGCLLSTFVWYYSSVDITYALISVAVIVGVMTILATILPQLFAGLGKALFISLLVGIIVELIMLLLGFGDSTIFDWFFVILFTLYVGYDWTLAQAYPRTINNAVTVSIALYLDMVNLFVRILSILGKKSN